MSAWGNIYEKRTDVVGRIMHAFEKRANMFYRVDEWRAMRDDMSGPLMAEPNAEHPDMVDAVEKEVEELVRAEARRAIDAAIGEALNSGDGSYRP